MKPLSAEQIDQFQGDLRAAGLAGVPLRFTPDSQPADELALERLGRHARRRIARDGLSDATLAEEDPQLPARYRAALTLWGHTGDMPLVLEGLSTTRQIERNLSRALLSTLAYLFLLLLVGYVGLAVFAWFTAPRIDAMHDDLTLVPAGSAPIGFDVQSTMWVALAVIPLVAIALAIGGWWAGGIRTIARRLGVKRYRVSAAAAAATRIVQALVSCGVPTERSVSVACDVVEADAAVREQVTRALGGDPPGRLSESRMFSMGEQFQLVAAERLATFNMAAPVLLVVVVGGAIALAYTAGMFGPVAALYRDFISADVWKGVTP